MRILHFCNKPPYPPKDGGAIGMNNTTMGLIDQGHSVKVIAISTPKHSSVESDLNNDYRQKTDIELFELNTDIKVYKAFFNLFSKKSYNIQRFDHLRIHQKLQDILRSEQYDVVILESVFLFPYLETIRKHSEAKIVLRAPNVEYIIWERLYRTEKNLLKKTYLRILAGRLKKAEDEIALLVDGIITVSEYDQSYFRKLNQAIDIAFIPTGIDMHKTTNASSIEADHLSVFFIGALDWMPNIEGLKWLMNKVWPKVLAHNKDLKLYIAGRNCPDWIQDQAESNIFVLGEVDDAQEYMLKHHVMVVPLFSGSGMRVKIVEGLMLKKAIVSTSIGADGLDLKSKEHLIIADDADSFAHNIVQLAADKTLYHQISTNGAQFAQKHYDNKKLAKDLHQFISNL